MASGSWIFRRSVPAIAAQAAFSLLFLVAVTAPSLQSGTAGTRLQGAEGSGSKTGNGTSTEVIPASTDHSVTKSQNGKGPAPEVPTPTVDAVQQQQRNATTDQEEVKGQSATKKQTTPSPAKPQDNAKNNSTNTSATTPSTPANPGAATSLAGPSATLAVALCAYMITVV